MTNHYSTTILTERKPGQHLGSEERGTIQALKKLGFSSLDFLLVNYILMDSIAFFYDKVSHLL